MKKKKDTHSVPINFVHKRINKMKPGFLCIENGSIKPTNYRSKYKANFLKKNILQIINQSREIINQKQLLVSVANLKFTPALSPKARKYGSSCFRTIYPQGLQISDWHYRIQILVASPLLHCDSRRVKRLCITYKSSYRSKICTCKGFLQIFNLLEGDAKQIEDLYQIPAKAKKGIVVKANQNAKELGFAAQSQKDSNNIILSISGGQDSIFLLFCLSFLQSQMVFKPNIIWCNHFWQKSSFYTALHLTKSALAFSSPIIEFLPFNMVTSPQLYQNVKTTFYSGNFRAKKNQGSKESGFCGFCYAKVCFCIAKTRSEASKVLKNQVLKTNFLSPSYLATIPEKERDFANKSSYKSAYKSTICTCFASNKSSYKYKYKSTICFASPKALQSLATIPFGERGKKICKNICTCKKAMQSLATIPFGERGKKICLQSKYKSAICFASPKALQSLATIPFGERGKKICTIVAKANQGIKELDFENQLSFSAGNLNENSKKICTTVAKANQSKAFTLCISFPKRQSKHQFSIKTGFYKTRTEGKNKKPKAYKKFIKEISETRARNWRHITIERASTFYGSTLCLYGHTLSDRVETILFNLIRGTKNKNCQALPWKRRHSTFCYNRFYPTFEQVIKNTHISFI